MTNAAPPDPLYHKMSRCCYSTPQGCRIIRNEHDRCGMEMHIGEPLDYLFRFYP